MNQLEFYARQKHKETMKQLQEVFNFEDLAAIRKEYNFLKSKLDQMEEEWNEMKDVIESNIERLLDEEEKMIESMYDKSYGYNEIDYDVNYI